LLGVLTGIGFSLLAIIYMLKDGKNLPPQLLTLHVGLAIVTVVCSWLLTQVASYRDRDGREIYSMRVLLILTKIKS
jgi:uncharacterized membrane protein